MQRSKLIVNLYDETGKFVKELTVRKIEVGNSGTQTAVLDGIIDSDCRVSSADLVIRGFGLVGQQHFTPMNINAGNSVSYRVSLHPDLVRHAFKEERQTEDKEYQEVFI